MADIPLVSHVHRVWFFWDESITFAALGFAEMGERKSPCALVRAAGEKDWSPKFSRVVPFASLGQRGFSDGAEHPSPAGCCCLLPLTADHFLSHYHFW